MCHGLQLVIAHGIYFEHYTMETLFKVVYYFGYRNEAITFVVYFCGERRGKIVY